MNNIFKHNFAKIPVNVGRISYINVAPIYYGLDNCIKPTWLQIVSAPPSVLNSMMAKGNLDISPVSTVAYAKNQKKWLLLPDLSIACFGKVMSVILASKYPFDKLNNKKVTLTDESATAAQLVKLLFSLKGVKPFYETGTVRNLKDIKNNAHTVLVTGDAALKEKWSNYYDYVWDLGDMWKSLTHSPFVFAIWAVRRSFAEKRPELVSMMADIFRVSKENGCQNIKRIAESASEKLGLSTDAARKYYSDLSYDLSPLQITGLNTFFRSLFNEKLLSSKVILSFFDQ